ncbi:starch phosphorylase [Halopseudomonas xinjiangensis]|uniref:Starch phosphorylase n=1 Tax=Halopseudomonas xinjiangensis TaxID=487184 RepID=A0A1H1UPG6_9GAMM|nr:alpha-glucan family phosphorylase [Halopseudomonas xinjiangensis]SDS73739.1 starch phosphorylase [Halopseudomonas xinjiangensis]
MTDTTNWPLPYRVNPAYARKVAYFSMEFAIDQALKIYSGGLGFLAGSHMRSAYQLRQNVIGVGILWKYGYYDQARNADQTLRVDFTKKYYPFLTDPGITVTVQVNGHDVKVKALCLPAQTFGSAPLYLLTTDIPENDHLARTITHCLYDVEPSARIAQSIVLGLGGAKVVEAMGGAELYHMNEAHALPLAFHLMDRLGEASEVRKRIVFTTHTPEKAGNEEHETSFLKRMGFFGALNHEQEVNLTGIHEHLFSHTLAALRVSHACNGVSRLHGAVANQMWEGNDGICSIEAITNSQNALFWQDKKLRQALDRNDPKRLITRKKEMKDDLFRIVADQTGKLFNRDVLTIVWARRFAHYKRATLLLHDFHRFLNLIERTDRPVQIIWAGKPFPFDHDAISVFNGLVRLSRKKRNIAVLTGYEIELSRQLKQGADVWLNTPVRPREASGTSGMTAAMNGAVNFSINDGWIPEFAKDGENSFIIPVTEPKLSEHEQNEADYQNLMSIFEDRIIPLYYDEPQRWNEIAMASMRDVTPAFDSDRMAREYYEKLYSAKLG